MVTIDAILESVQNAKGFYVGFPKPLCCVDLTVEQMEVIEGLILDYQNEHCRRYIAMDVRWEEWQN